MSRHRALVPLPFWLRRLRPLRGLPLLLYAGFRPSCSSTVPTVACAPVDRRSCGAVAARFAQCLGHRLLDGACHSTRYRSDGNWGKAPHPLAALPSGPDCHRPPSRIFHRHRRVRAIESLVREIVRFRLNFRMSKIAGPGVLLPAEPRAAYYEALQGVFEVGPANEYSSAEAERWNPAEPNVIPSFSLALTEKN